MPITSIGRTGGANTSTGLNIAKAASGLTDDFVLVVGMVRHATTKFSTPANWQSRYDDVVNTNRLQIFSHAFSASEPATTTFTTGASLPYWLAQWTFRGVDLDNPFMIAPQVAAATTGTAVTGPSLTPGDPDGAALWYWLGYAASAANGVNMVAPAGLDTTWTQIRPATSIAGYCGQIGALLPAEEEIATGTKVATASVSVSWRGLGLVLRPAVDPDTGAWFPFMNYPSPTATAAGDVLDIGPAPRTNHFSVQLADPNGAAIETHDQDEIAAGYGFYPWLWGNPAGDRVTMRAPVGGPVTSGASSTRCEWRELNADGSNIAFDALTGTHVLHGRSTIRHAPPNNPGIVLAQLHNGSADRLTFLTQRVAAYPDPTGTWRLRFRLNGTSVAGELVPAGIANIQDVDFEWKIEIASNVARFYLGDMVTPVYTSGAAALTSTGSASWYFKAGCYLQTPASGATDDLLEYGEVEIRDLWHSHA